MSEQQNLNVVIVGGSVAGLACAHALLQAGTCTVTVFERASSISAAGAGLGLGEEALDILRAFGLGKQLDTVSLPLPTDINRAVRPDGAVRMLSRDDSYGHRSLHWSDLHQMLLKALPHGIMHFGTMVTSVEQSEGCSRVRVKAESKAGQQAGSTEADSDQKEHISAEADLVIAADGSMSNTRQKFVPDVSRRYSGYCAWRGVVTDEEAPEQAAAARAAYDELGSAIYFDLACGTHAVLYELPGRRLNWLWYVNQPEPQLQGHSVTVKADDARVSHMHAQAERTFTPALARLMQATKAPFINAIFDREPLQRWVFGRVVLVGEAAHPTTPHALRSTNMAIADAGCLGRCLAGVQGPEGGLAAALEGFQRERMHATRREVLFSRHLGRLKQGLDRQQDWYAADARAARATAQANMAAFCPENGH